MMLILPIKKKWYDMILSGEKKEEYREWKPYYTSRIKNICFRNGFDGVIGQECLVKFINGYSRTSPHFYAKVRIQKGEGRPEWGAVPGKIYWILEILDVGGEHDA